MGTVSAEKQNPGRSIVVTSSMAGVTGAASEVPFCDNGPGYRRRSGNVCVSAAIIYTYGKMYDSVLAKESAIYTFDKTVGVIQPARSPYCYERIPEPEEIANIGVFLASDLAAAIYVQSIVADSGKTAGALRERTIGPTPTMKPF
ncbi:hypothetical protein NM208_g15746 [Fusarium decemcellulare]|uniref:Uncharacterized protein n=1 Tax=Fusarium decemcellulare TaxID=57161 RepID=A0ACC1RCQ1_9HYPO|nr:hypothetical protein NM208_g15746 [Fusarium decemcellulare]